MVVGNKEQLKGLLLQKAHRNGHIRHVPRPQHLSRIDSEILNTRVGYQHLISSTHYTININTYIVRLCANVNLIDLLRAFIVSIPLPYTIINRYIHTITKISLSCPLRSPRVVLRSPRSQRYKSVRMQADTFIFAKRTLSTLPRRCCAKASHLWNERGWFHLSITKLFSVVHGCCTVRSIEPCKPKDQQEYA